MNDIHEQEPTLQDVLDAVVESSTAIEGRLQRLESDMSTVKSDIVSIKSSMVTKPYLDDKLADLKGDLVLVMRKEGVQMRALVELLQKKNVLSDEDARQILSMDPFPQVA